MCKKPCNDNNKSCSPFFIFFDEKNERDLDNFWHRKITLKVRIVLFSTFNSKTIERPKTFLWPFLYIVLWPNLEPNLSSTKLSCLQKITFLTFPFFLDNFDEYCSKINISQFNSFEARRGHRISGVQFMFWLVLLPLHFANAYCEIADYFFLNQETPIEVNRLLTVVTSILTTVLVLASLVCHFFVDSRPEYERPGEWFFFSILYFIQAY